MTHKYEIAVTTDGVGDVVLPLEAKAENETYIEAEEIAEEWLRDGAWDTSEGTIWLRADYEIRAVGGGDPIDSGYVRIAIDPPEPPCTHAEGHDWVEKAVWGSGGGVRSVDRCLHCGVELVTDTWATDPSTGEQGLRSIEYRAGEEVAE